MKYNQLALVLSKFQPQKPLSLQYKIVSHHHLVMADPENTCIYSKRGRSSQHFQLQPRVSSQVYKSSFLLKKGNNLSLAFENAHYNRIRVKCKDFFHIYLL